MSLQPSVLTVEQAAETLQISRAHAYTMVKAGEIPTVRLGRRVLVPRVALERFLNGDTTTPTTATT